MSLDNLPVEWCLTQLGQIVNVSSGVGFPKDFQGKKDQQIPVYKVSDISYCVLNHKGILQTANNSVSENDAKVLKGHLFAEGSTLFAKIGEAVKLNRRAFVKKSGLADNNVMGVTGFNYVNDKYIFYFLNTIDLALHSRSTTIPSIRKSDIEELQIGLPSICEQQEIVRQLDLMLAQVEQIKARLDAIPAILKKFRQSVLADAVSGKLTEEWRNTGLESWKKTRFSQICKEITVGFVGKMSDQYKESGIPFLRSQNVRAFKYSDENLLFISEEFHSKIYKSRLEPGDLAIVRSGAPGTTCVIPDHLTIANCSDLVIARPSPELNPHFGCIFMNSEVGQRNVSDNQVGVAQQHFNVGSMKKMEILLPPLDEQNEIVNRVENFFKVSNHIEHQILLAQKRVNLLTHSILAKAFSGELTAQWREQHQDLITGLNSAEALLAKIQAEREASKLVKKVKKVKSLS